MSYFNHKHSKANVEHWVPIYDGYYEISCWGRCRRIKAGEWRSPAKSGYMLKPTANLDGYLYYILCIKGKYIRPIWAAQIVASTFVGPKPDGMEINHKDLDRTNNCWNNLEYLTHADNIRYSFAAGAHDQSGELNGNAKLVRAEVRDIRKLYASGKYTQAQLGKQFDVTSVMISKIVREECWRD